MSKLKNRVTATREKLAAKLPEKMRKGKAPARITNDTIAEHREQVLADGRKFKYPLQYSKHKILINAIIVAIIALVLAGVWLWVSLYRAQTTGDFYYSATQILPLPVANVDGQDVPYSDYLRRIRADIYYYENQDGKRFNTTDGQRELNYNRRRELDNAERTAYAVRLAKLRKITVSTAEVDAKLKAQREGDNSDEASVERTLKTYYNWTASEYRKAIYNQLLEQKVAFAIDTTASKRIKEIEQRLNSGEDFATVAKEVSDDTLAKKTSGAVTAKTGDLDSMGLIAAARKLEVGQTSGVISSRNMDGVYCYFIVKLDAKSESETKYSVIQVNLTQFDKEFAALKDQGKIREYIRIEVDEGK